MNTEYLSTESAHRPIIPPTSVSLSVLSFLNSWHPLLLRFNHRRSISRRRRPLRKHTPAPPDRRRRGLGSANRRRRPAPPAFRTSAVTPDAWEPSTAAALARGSAAVTAVVAVVSRGVIPGFMGRDRRRRQFSEAAVRRPTDGNTKIKRSR